MTNRWLRLLVFLGIIVVGSLVFALSSIPKVSVGFAVVAGSVLIVSWTAVLVYRILVKQDW